VYIACRCWPFKHLRSNSAKNRRIITSVITLDILIPSRTCSLLYCCFFNWYLDLIFCRHFNTGTCMWSTVKLFIEFTRKNCKQVFLFRDQMPSNCRYVNSYTMYFFNISVLKFLSNCSCGTKTEITE
jgi:hypothetical protein